MILGSVLCLAAEEVQLLLPGTLILVDTTCTVVINRKRAYYFRWKSLSGNLDANPLPYH